MAKYKIDIPESLTQSILTPQEECLELPRKNQNLFIGIPKERTLQEHRVALDPAAVKMLVKAGHRVVIESEAGLGSNFLDFDYSEAGAEIGYNIETVYQAGVILKVAPPSLKEIEFCKPNQILISPIHLPMMSEDYLYRLKKKRVTAIAQEYMKDEHGTYPFVRVMSEMAGISAMQTAAELLSTSSGGRGILLGGIPGVPPAKVVILGAGVVAEVATKVALGFGAEVRVFDNSIRKLMRLQQNVGQRIYTGTISSTDLEQELRTADVAIGAIHSKQGRTPCVVSEDMVQQMKAGAVVIDVSIDQGGCFATSRLTTHARPTFMEHDVIHYCVPNIVSKIPQTSSRAISNILTPFLLDAAGTEGVEALLRKSKGFRNGVYMYKGCLTNKYMSERFSVKFTDLDLLLMSNL